MTKNPLDEHDDLEISEHPLMNATTELGLGNQAVPQHVPAPRSTPIASPPRPRVPEEAAEPEQVDHPAHYQSGHGLEVIDVIEHFELGFHLGNAVKYILRAGRKGEVVLDLRKALWYLEREIAGRAPR